MAQQKTPKWEQLCTFECREAGDWHRVSQNMSFQEQVMQSLGRLSKPLILP